LRFAFCVSSRLINMTPKIITIAAVLATVAMLAGVTFTIPITAAYSDESEPESNLKCKGFGTTSGQSSVDNSISCEQGSGGIGGQNEEGSGGIGEQPEEESPTTATLIIIKNVECLPGDVCPDLPSPSEFGFSFPVGSNPDPPTPEGSSQGTPVTLGPGDYRVEENVVPDGPIGLILEGTSSSPECDSSRSGPLRAGEQRTCEFTNTYAVDT
jgi:hypothetical protein